MRLVIIGAFEPHPCRHNRKLSRAWLLTGIALALRAAISPKVTDPLQRALGLGLLGVLGSVATHAFLDNLFVHEMTVHLGLLLGLCLAAGASPSTRANS